MRGGRIVALGALILVATATTTHASEPEIAGMGARSSAMAGTGAADSSSYDSLYANPAGLMDATRRRLEVGFVYGDYGVNFDGSRRNIATTTGVMLGAAVPLGFRGIMKDRLSIGLGFYFPTSVLNRAKAGYPGEDRTPLLDNRTEVVSALVGIAARLHSRVTFGISVLVLATLVGDVLITPDPAGRITTLVDQQIVVRFAPILGLRVRAHRDLRLGLTFRGESKAEYDVYIRNTLGMTLPVQIPTLRIAGAAQYDPMQMALEAAWRIHPAVSLSGGLTWKHWSAYALPTENATAATPPQPSTNFHDTVVPRVAVEFGMPEGRVRITGRAGYFYEWSPAPTTGYLLDADRHVVTTGANLKVKHRYGAFDVDLFGQLHKLAGSSRVNGEFFIVGLAIGEDL